MQYRAHFDTRSDDQIIGMDIPLICKKVNEASEEDKPFFYIMKIELLGYIERLRPHLMDQAVEGFKAMKFDEERGGIPVFRPRFDMPILGLRRPIIGIRRDDAPADEPNDDPDTGEFIFNIPEPIMRPRQRPPVDPAQQAALEQAKRQLLEQLKRDMDRWRAEIRPPEPNEENPQPPKPAKVAPVAQEMLFNVQIPKTQRRPRQ